VILDPDYKSNGWIYLVTCHGVKNAQGKLDARGQDQPGTDTRRPLGR
jgi:hypothetical protein